MTREKWIVLGIALAMPVVLVATVLAGPLVQPSEPHPSMGAQAALGTGFTYQGQLKASGEPVNETCQVAFRLYDQWGTGGNQVGDAITTSVPITDGLFTVVLNSGGEFGSTAFTGDARWLGIMVKCPGDAAYADLGRQELTAVPYALYALGADWDGLTDVPAGFADGVDNDTTYTSGFGLDLSGNQFSVVTGTVQARVSGACAAGSTIRTVNADGTVVCQTDAPLNRPLAPTANVSTALDSAEDVGGHTSVTIGADGLGLISYYDASNSDLKVAHCNDVACTSATLTTLDSTGWVGRYTSVAIGADGLALISYYDPLNDDLKVAHCDDVACTSAVITTLDSTGDVGHFTSVMIGADGLGLISYRDVTNGNLKAAHCNNIACTGVTTTTLDSTGWVGWYTSVTIGADGLGLISYQDDSNDDLKVAHCNDIACTGATITTLDSTGNVGEHTSVTIGADGLGLISYRDVTNGDLKAAHCSNLTCTNATVTTLDSTGSATQFSASWSVTIGADGLGLISYYDDANDDLKVAHCNDIACTGATITTLDSTGDIGRYSSVTIGADGLALISYYDVTNGGLKVAHCSNVFCVPYFRRR